MVLPLLQHETPQYLAMCFAYSLALFFLTALRRRKHDWYLAIVSLETSTTNKFPSCQVSLWSFFLYRSSEHWCHFMLSVRLVRVNIEMPSNFLSHCIDTKFKQKGYKTWETFVAPLLRVFHFHRLQNKVSYVYIILICITYYKIVRHFQLWIGSTCLAALQTLMFNSQSQHFDLLQLMKNHPAYDWTVLVLGYNYL